VIRHCLTLPSEVKGQPSGDIEYENNFHCRAVKQGERIINTQSWPPQIQNGLRFGPPSTAP